MPSSVRYQEPTHCLLEALDTKPRHPTRHGPSSASGPVVAVRSQATSQRWPKAPSTPASSPRPRRPSRPPPPLLALELVSLRPDVLPPSRTSPMPKTRRTPGSPPPPALKSVSSSDASSPAAPRPCASSSCSLCYRSPSRRRASCPAMEPSPFLRRAVPPRRLPRPHFTAPVPPLLRRGLAPPAPSPSKFAVALAPSAMEPRPRCQRALAAAAAFYSCVCTKETSELLYSRCARATSCIGRSKPVAPVLASAGSVVSSFPVVMRL